MNKISLSILGLLFLVSFTMANHHHPIQFETIDINLGLSQNSVMTVAKDMNGFMWFGTEDGLNRYDGITFKQFRHNPMDSSSINSNSIYSSLLDSQGNLWIGTYVSGLNKYIDDTESFVHYPHFQLDSLSPGEGSIWGLIEDHEGYIWVGTSGGGLFRLDPTTGISVPVKSLVTNDETLADPVVYALFEDHDHQLWISTLNGLSVLDLKTYTIKNYRYDKDKPSSLFDNNVNYVYESFDGENYKIWVGTNWGGLDCYDPETDSFIHHGYKSTINPDYAETSVSRMLQVGSDRLWVGTDSEGILILDLNGNLLEIIGKKVYDETALNDDAIRSIYDDGDIVWVGTAGGGVSKYIRNRKKFHNLTYDPLNPEGLHENRILKIAKDSKGNLWIATWTSGLTYYNPLTNEFKIYRHDPVDSGSLSDDGIQDILVDQNDNLWVIGASTSLDLLRNNSDTFMHIKADSSNPKGLQSDYLLSMIEDQEGNILLGSWNDGLFRLDPTSLEFETFRTPGNKDLNLGNISFYCMFEDSRGKLWIGAENEGLIGFDRNTMTLKQYKASPGDPTALPNNDVMCFYEDGDGYIWLGTYGGGISRFNPRNGTFENFSIEDGLPSSAIYNIFQDANGWLWMSTNNGLAQYHPKKKILKTYGIADGVLSKEFNPAGCQLDNGWLYFGGVKGITYFHPDQIKSNRHVPPVKFTDLSIMNVPIGINQKFKDRVILEKSITTTPLLELYPNDLFFSLSFASLDYYHPSSNSYAYYMEGFDQEWRQIGHQRSVTFTNLPPGEFNFQLKGSNNDQVWNNNGLSLKIIMYPEFYETWWFISSSILLFILIGFIAYRLRTNFLIKRGLELEKHNIQLNAQIESRRKAHVKASERANYFRAVIAQSPIPMAIHNSEGNITHLNSGWVELWGAEGPEEIIRDYHVDDDKLANQLSLGKSFRKAAEGSIIEIPEVNFIADNGSTKVVQILLYPLKNIVGMTNQVMVSLEDVTEIVRQRNLLEKSILEKDLLLKEVHHRVKNNLQLVASLLGLQKAGTQNDKTLQTLDDIKNRVNSMALVHDALYRSPEFDNIDISTYIQDLTNTLQAAFGGPAAPIEIRTNIPEISLPVDIAVPCGLMINEMVTNALKYAFPDPTKQDKHILIQFTEYEDEHLRLEVIDNGIGLQKPVVWDSIHSLGLYLLKILSEQQLMGTVNLKDGPGAHFIIEFPIYPNFDD
ncbi:MAG: PAS domain S-box protein [Candidatus Marinimicrobia bacterium]|nr:PAS domain S-box protein [Candidatus Neomarinimicrobiota bacterium]